MEIRINNVDISKYGVKAWNVKYEYSTFTNDSVWSPGMLSPVLLPSIPGKKKLIISVIVREKNRSEIWGKSRDLVSVLIEPFVLEIYENNSIKDIAFHGVLINAKQVELSLNRFHKAELEFEGYATAIGFSSFDTVVPRLKTQSFKIECDTEFVTPAVLNIMTINTFNLRMQGIFGSKFGLGDNFMELRNVETESHKRFTIDGETGRVIFGTEDAFDKISKITEFPNLKKGVNELVVDNSKSWYDCEINITYRSRFL